MTGKKLNKLHKRRHYIISHRIAKIIMALVVMLLLNIDGTLTWCSAGIVLIWVFGTNPIAYVIESMMNWDHRHDKL